MQIKEKDTQLERKRYPVIHVLSQPILMRPFLFLNMKVREQAYKKKDEELQDLQTKWVHPIRRAT